MTQAWSRGRNKEKIFTFNLLSIFASVIEKKDELTVNGNENFIV
jgi:hypothetical protein